MHSAPDLITRWPALEVAATRARLQNSLRISPGPLTETLKVAKKPAWMSSPMISATPRDDLSIPGELFSFGTLELALAVGDFAALDAAGRRALHAHLPTPDPALLRELGEMLLARLPRTP